MIKYGCMALAIACSLAAPAAQAQGSFFLAAHAGRATYESTTLDNDTAHTHALSGGYRWQATPTTQAGFEIGAGKVDEIGQRRSNIIETARIGVDATYWHLGANARFSFGPDSRWFAVARGGVMRSEQSLRSSYYNVYIGETRRDSASNTGASAYFGAGIGADIAKNISVSAMINRYGYADFEDYYQDVYGQYDLDIGPATTTTVGLEVRF